MISTEQRAKLELTKLDKYIANFPDLQLAFARESLRELLAAALAACAREARLDEARWWKLQIESRIAGINFYQHKNFEVADRIEVERIAALERAAGEKA